MGAPAPAGNAAAMDPNKRRRRRRRNGPGASRPMHKPLNPFDVFACYHLGLGENKRFRPMGVREVARRLNCTPNDVYAALRVYRMDNDSLMRLKGVFEVNWARLDIKAAPDGVDREAIAEDRFSDFIDAGLSAGLFQSAPHIDWMMGAEGFDDLDDDHDGDDGDDEHDGDDHDGDDHDGDDDEE
jgi:hypothetical protein